MWKQTSIVFVLGLCLVAASLTSTLEDVLSIPSTTFLGVGSSGSAALVRINGTCVGDMVTGAPSANSAAGTANRFRRRTASFWNDRGAIAAATSTASDAYGTAVASLEFGDEAFMSIGSPGADAGNGRVDVYRLNLATDAYELQTTLTAPTSFGGLFPKEFGGSLAMTSNKLAVGAPGTNSDLGAVFKYAYDGVSAWAADGTPDLSTLGVARLGASMDAFAGYVLVGGPQYNSAMGMGKLYNVDAGWSTTTLEPVSGVTVDKMPSNSLCGTSVAIMIESGALILGCPGVERLGYFEYPSGAFRGLQQTYRPFSVASGSNFGASMARVGDPSNPGGLLVGAPLDNGGNGSVSYLEPILNIDSLQVFVPVSEIVSPSGIVENFGTDLTANFPYFGVGCPTESSVSTPVPSARATCNAYGLDLAGYSAGDIVSTLTAQEQGGSGTFEVKVWTSANTSKPPVVFDTAQPHSSALYLGTPNEAFGGPGVGSAGASGSYQNDVALGNALIIPRSVPSTDPRPSFGFMFFEFETEVTLETMTFVNPKLFSVIFTYDGNNTHTGTTALPWLGNNAVVTKNIFRPAVKKVVFFSFSNVAIADITFRPCNGGSGGGGNNPGGDGVSGHYYVYRVGADNPTCDLGLASSSPASTLSTILANLL